MESSSWAARLPWSLVVIAASLMLIGLAAIERGDELFGAGDLFSRQAMWVVLGIPAMLAVTVFPYRELRPYSYMLFGLTLPLLLVVYLLPPVNGSRRWIPLGLLNFQPSELAKLTFVMALAHYLMYRRNYRRLSGLLAPFVITMIPLLLILREPDLGTAVLFLPTLFAMLFAAGARLRHLSSICLLGIAMLPLLWYGMSAEQKSRVTALFSQTDGGPAPRGDGYHLHQSKMMIAMGGPWGSELAGMPTDDPLAYRLPAGRTDFIFCLVAERWGLPGCLLTVCLYMLLCVRGMMIAAATREPYGRLLAVGIVTLIGSQAVINTGMTVGLMPITGLTLPLMSYGGSSLLATCVSLGLLMNVAMRPGYEMAGEPFQFSRTG